MIQLAELTAFPAQACGKIGEKRTISLLKSNSNLTTHDAKAPLKNTIRIAFSSLPNIDEP